MAGLRAGDTLVLASHNEGKLAEFRDLLAPFGVSLVSAGALGLPEPEETGASFNENARIKARAAAEASGLPALADDSGLEVDALGCAPGIYSARWAGPRKDFAAAMRRIAEMLDARGARTPADRRARFVAALCLATPDGAMTDLLGTVEGTIVWPPRGDNGFGYDPIFLPEGHDRTFGEMSAAEKHGWTQGTEPLSHRARAFASFARAVLGAA